MRAVLVGGYVDGLREIVLTVVPNKRMPGYLLQNLGSDGKSTASSQIYDLEELSNPDYDKGDLQFASMAFKKQTVRLSTTKYIPIEYFHEKGGCDPRSLTNYDSCLFSQCSGEFTHGMGCITQSAMANPDDLANDDLPEVEFYDGSIPVFSHLDVCIPPDVDLDSVSGINFNFLLLEKNLNDQTQTDFINEKECQERMKKSPTYIANQLKLNEDELKKYEKRFEVLAPQTYDIVAELEEIRDRTAYIQRTSLEQVLLLSRTLSFDALVNDQSQSDKKQQCVNSNKECNENQVKLDALLTTVKDSKANIEVLIKTSTEELEKYMDMKAKLETNVKATGKVIQKAKKTRRGISKKFSRRSLYSEEKQSISRVILSRVKGIDEQVPKLQKAIQDLEGQRLIAEAQSKTIHSEATSLSSSASRAASPSTSQTSGPFDVIGEAAAVECVPIPLKENENEPVEVTPSEGRLYKMNCLIHEKVLAVRDHYTALNSAEKMERKLGRAIGVEYPHSGKGTVSMAFVKEQLHEVERDVGREQENVRGTIDNLRSKIETSIAESKKELEEKGDESKADFMNHMKQRHSFLLAKSVVEYLKAYGATRINTETLPHVSL